MRVFKFSLGDLYRHADAGEWEFSIGTITSDFEYDNKRSLFSIGKVCDYWHIDILWFNVAPKILNKG